nr:MAG TPA: hypothetical protein [Inoviridae sp.]
MSKLNLPLFARLPAKFPGLPAWVSVSFDTSRSRKGVKGEAL